MLSPLVLVMMLLGWTSWSDPESMLTLLWLRQGGRGGRMGLYNECDLLSHGEVQQAISLIRKHRPKILWVAFPCGATPPIQHLSALTPEGWEKGVKRRQRSRRLVRNGIQVIEAHLCQNGILASVE